MKFASLDELKKKTDKPARKSGGGEKVRKFLSISDGESFRLRFLQELTEDGANYDEDRGTASVFDTHANPDNWRKSALCTGDDESENYQCWACSQLPNDRGWKAKQHLVVNVAVEVDGEWEVKVLDQKFTPAHVAEDIVAFAAEYGTLTDRDYKISRKGDKRETNYSLIPLAEKDEDKSVAAKDRFDLDELFRKVPNKEQSGFYLEDSDSSSAEGWTD